LWNQPNHAFRDEPLRAVMVNPSVVRGALVALDDQSGSVVRIVVFQYNPDSLVNDFEPAPQTPADGELVAPPAHTITFQADFDATDALEHPDQNLNVAAFGLWPQVAAIQLLMWPSLSGMEAPAKTSVLFVFGAQRVLPVTITGLTLVEEAFDAQLNPIRVTASVQLRVLSSHDTQPSSRAHSIALTAEQTLGRLAALLPSVAPLAIGLENIP
jgi:hypothetical protein